VFLKILIFVLLNNGIINGIAPEEITKSLVILESPAILPRAQTACSHTSSEEELKSLIKEGIAPAWITTPVSSDVPLAIFVNAHVDSNCNLGK